MKIEQKRWTGSDQWQSISDNFEGKKAQLVLAFGDRFALSAPERYHELEKFYPQADIVMISTSGNVLGNTIEDNSIIATAISFEKGTTIETRRININEVNNCTAAGEFLGSNLPQEGLKHVLLFSDGHSVNGSSLVQGISKELPPAVFVTGGLAGDSTRFERTLIGANAPPSEGEVIAIGFYGSHVEFGFGSMGGWDPFGIERKITRSNNTLLHELDGKCALDLYKEYLGEDAKELPSSALLFPLAIRKDEQSEFVVRTILKIDEKNKTMGFAGEVPEGWYAQFMKANFDRLIEGATQAAQLSHEMLGGQPAELALLISCVGRRLVLGQRTDEEIDSIRDVLGQQTPIIGYYSYGEIAPTSPKVHNELHNQTMTITIIRET